MSLHNPIPRNLTFSFAGLILHTKLLACSHKQQQSVQHTPISLPLKVSTVTQILNTVLTTLFDDTQKKTNSKLCISFFKLFFNDKFMALYTIF